MKIIADPASTAGNGGRPAVQRTATELWGAACRIGRDEHLINRQRGRVDRLLSAPLGEGEPIAQVGPLGRLGQPVVCVLGGRGDRLAQCPYYTKTR